MRPLRLAFFLILTSILVSLIETRSAGQAKAKPKPKPGEPLVHDPADLPKLGDPLSIRTPVQRPGPLKGVRSWTIETKRHRWYPTILALSQDGKHIATGGYDGIIRLWNVETGQPEHVIEHPRGVRTIAWSPKGNYFVSGDYGGTLRVFDAMTASLTKEIASTQRLVEESVQSINRFARELDIHQAA